MPCILHNAFFCASLYTHIAPSMLLAEGLSFLKNKQEVRKNSPIKEITLFRMLIVQIVNLHKGLIFSNSLMTTIILRYILRCSIIDVA